MELIRGLHNLRAGHRGGVATIGNFDGVHLGHQRVLEQLRSCADRRGTLATVIVFEPQPQEYFTPAMAPRRLYGWRQKFRLICAGGIDHMLCLRFDQQLADLEPEGFVRTVLLDGLGISHLVVGDDFHFGRGRAGDFRLLQLLGKQHGFEVSRAATVYQGDERISSTRIRGLLKSGDFAAAAALMGRPFTLQGRVAHGHGLGRELGFPTANVHLSRAYRFPVSGIFAAYVRGISATPLAAAVYVGQRPVLKDDRPVMEIHVLDFDGDLYGQQVEVEFVRKLRQDRGFDSPAELAQQIATDVEQARTCLQAHSNNRPHTKRPHTEETE